MNDKVNRSLGRWHCINFSTYLIKDKKKYIMSHKTCTHFVLCFVLYIPRVPSGFMESIYPYHSGLLHWHCVIIWLPQRQGISPKRDMDRLVPYQTPVPLTIFRSNSQFHQNLPCSGLKYTLPITTKFCTLHDIVTVLTCAKFRCDWLNIFQTRALHILIKFWIRSKYH